MAFGGTSYFVFFTTSLRSWSDRGRGFFQSVFKAEDLVSLKLISKVDFQRIFLPRRETNHIKEHWQSLVLDICRAMVLQHVW